MLGQIFATWERLNLFQRVSNLEKQQRQLMGDVSNVSTELASVKATLDALAPEVPTILTAIQSLQAQIAALKGSTTSQLSAADQAVLDGIQSDANTISTSISNINAALAPANPAPAQGS